LGWYRIGLLQTPPPPPLLHPHTCLLKPKSQTFEFASQTPNPKPQTPNLKSQTFQLVSLTLNPLFEPLFLQESWRWVLDTNVMGLVNCIQVFLPQMESQKGECHMIATASGAGIYSQHRSTMAPYVASKHCAVIVAQVSNPHSGYLFC